jgi:ATP-dependent Clp protease adaptor protein ClpS
MTSEKQLILYNDTEHDYNYVRACLIKYCDHDFLQAEQCIIIVHNNGKCVIKQGDIMDILPIEEALVKKGLLTKLISLN